MDIHRTKGHSDVILRSGEMCRDTSVFKCSNGTNSLFSRIASRQVPMPRCLSPAANSLYSRIAGRQVPKPRCFSPAANSMYSILTLFWGLDRCVATRVCSNARTDFFAYGWFMAVWGAFGLFHAETRSRNPSFMSPHFLEFSMLLSFILANNNKKIVVLKWYRGGSGKRFS